MKETLHIAFRVDANSSIGMGHLRRCLTLAKQFYSDGHRVTLISHQSSQTFFSKKIKGIRTIFVQNKFDTQVLMSFDVVVIDGYEFGVKFEREVKITTNALIVVIGDHAKRKHTADLYINQNQSVSKTSLSPYHIKHCKFLLGLDYALLDEGVTTLKRKRVSKKLNRILVTFGSAGPVEMYDKTFQAAEKIGFQGHIDFVFGFTPLQKRKSKSFVAKYHGFKDIIPLLDQADLVIGASGVSLLERSFLGIPSISVTMSQDQVSNTAFMAKKRATHYLCHYNKVTIRDLSKALEKICGDLSYRSALSRNAKKVIDGKGAQRVKIEVYEAMKHHRV